MVVVAFLKGLVILDTTSEIEPQEHKRVSTKSGEGHIHVGCLAPIRRKFSNAAKVAKKPGSARAHIAKTYRIENHCCERLKREKITREEFVGLRAEGARALLEEFCDWIEERIDEVNPKSALGEALEYARKQWPKLLHYLEAWYLTPDTNSIEREIRPFVTGRNNWIFSDTPRGAHAGAALYSLVATARANGLEPYHYFRFLFTRLPAAQSEEELRKLLSTTLVPADFLNP
jgi:transposase